MRNKISGLFILMAMTPSIIFARADSADVSKNLVHRNFSIQAMYQFGYVFATNPFLRGQNAASDTIDMFQAFSLKFSKQTTGNEFWEQIYRYPYWGIGIYTASFYNSKEIGTPVALYGFFNAPFLRHKRFSFNYELGFGATFNWKSFDPVNNQYNVAIGAGESFMIDAGLNLDFKLVKRFYCNAGFSLTHFSNGALKKPNFGINTIAPRVSLRYSFSDDPVFIKQSIPEYANENEWLVTIFGGLKNMVFDSANIDIKEKYEGAYFPVIGFTTAINRQISYKSKVGFGFALAYNSSLNAQVAIENNDLEAVAGPAGEKLQLSVFPSYELIINKLSIIIQPSFYVYRKKIENQSPVFHQRIGLKYHFTNRFFAGLTLVDYKFHVSDYIEWNLGYRIKWKSG